jgi:hypothetical protein
MPRIALVFQIRELAGRQRLAPRYVSSRSSAPQRCFA